MITVLIPIGEVPFFPQAVARNIKETIGTDEYKLRFLVANPSIKLMQELENVPGNFEINAVNLNPKIRGTHLNLLDWAFYNLSLTEWVYVQHADMFWVTTNWLSFFQKHTDKSVAIMPSYCATGHQYKHYKYRLKGKPLVRCHDFSGLYHKPTILKHKLKFWWLPVGKCNKPLVINNLPDIEVIHSNRKILASDILDGSDLISLYLNCLGQNLVCEVSEPLYYHHCWDMFGITWVMNRQGNIINVNRKLEDAMTGIQNYSWCSSFMFDCNKWKNCIFPWSALIQIIKPVESEFAKFISKYNTNCPHLGYKLDGVTEVKFADKSFAINKNISIL